MAHDDGHSPFGATTRDPVCGMAVDPATTPHHAALDGTAYHFCSARCRDKFIADPARYLTRDTPTPAAPPPGTVWTCPMHSEIRRDHPGACPICGMALEPLTATADSRPSPELTDMTRRFRFALALGLPVLALEMSGHLFPALHRVVPPTTSVWIQFVLATPVVLWAGWPFFARGWASLRTRHLNMFTLIAMGTGVAWGFSAVAALAPAAFPAAFRGMDGAVTVYFESAAVITVLVLLGQVLDCARASAPRARSGRCSTSRRRPRGASPPTGRTRKCRWRRW